MKLLGLVVALALLAPLPSLADQSGYQVLPNGCGTGAAPSGQVRPGTMEPAGRTCVLPPFSRAALLTTTVTLTSTGYTAGQSIGAGLQLDASALVGANVASVRVRSVKIAWTTASSSAAGGVYFELFSAAPSTTLTNGSAPTWASADAAKFQAVLLAGEANPITSTGLFYDSDITGATSAAPLAKAVTTDAAGKLNLALFASAAITYTTPTTATVTVEIEY